MGAIHGCTWSMRKNTRERWRTHMIEEAYATCWVTSAYDFIYQVKNIKKLDCSIINEQIG